MYWARRVLDLDSSEQCRDRRGIMPERQWGGKKILGI